MLKDVRLLRIPVEVRRGTVHDVRAKVVGGSQEFRTRGKRELLWSGQFEPHGDIIHQNLETELDVLNHIGDKHLSASGPIGSITPNQTSDFVDVIFKVENIPATFLTNTEGEAGGKYPDLETFCSNYSSGENNENEFAAGEYELKIEIEGDVGNSELRAISFETGPCLDDLDIIDTTTEY
jgi:hypothetical protein